MRNALTCSLLCLALAGCSSESDVALSFAGVVNGEPAACGQDYAGVGTTSSTLTLTDFRLYVHDLRVVTEDGTEVPVELEQDGVWQYENVALLDFEDGNGCDAGTAETNTTIRGIAADGGPFTAVRFRLGVPFDLNHADVTLAPSPMNLMGMFWNWNGGYKFVRVDGRTTGLPDGYRIHLGSTGCDGDPMMGNVTMCANENRPDIELAMDPATGSIQVDLGALLSASDIDNDGGGMPGCMSGPTDPDCAPVFDGFGITGGNQRLFVAVD